MDFHWSSISWAIFPNLSLSCFRHALTGTSCLLQPTRALWSARPFRWLCCYLVSFQLCTSMLHLKYFPLPSLQYTKRHASWCVLMSLLLCKSSATEEATDACFVDIFALLNVFMSTDVDLDCNDVRVGDGWAVISALPSWSLNGFTSICTPSSSTSASLMQRSCLSTNLNVCSFFWAPSDFVYPWPLCSCSYHQVFGYLGVL